MPNNIKNLAPHFESEMPYFQVLNARKLCYVFNKFVLGSINGLQKPNS